MLGVGPRATLSISLLFIILQMTPTSDASEGNLDIFAGDDKTARVDVPLDFNDAWIQGPDPPDPDAEYFASWDFDLTRDRDGDGIRDNDGESHHLFTSWTFREKGKYTVTLTVTDGEETVKDTMTVTVIENWAPEITADAEVTAHVDRPIKLEVTAWDPDHYCEHLGWEWDFGDGFQSIEPGPLNHTYTSLGNFTVWVCVTDPKEASDVASMTVHVVDRVPPIADAGEYTTVIVDHVVIFDGTASRDNQCIVSWLWSFDYNGSNIVMEGPRPSFAFDEVGSYRVRLTVVDGSGNEGYHTIVVQVLADVGPEGHDADGTMDHLRVEPGRRQWVALGTFVAAFTISMMLNLALAGDLYSKRPRRE